VLPRPLTIRRILAIGYPAALEQLFMQFGFFLYYRFAARYGTSAVAAYFIGVRILAMSFLPGFGFAAAAGTLVGQNLGGRRPDLAERSGWESTRLSIFMMSGLGLLIVAFARPIARCFIDDPLVIDDAVMFIQVLGAAQPLMAIDFTLGGALRGAGDTRFPLWSVLIGFYICRLGFAYTATYVLNRPCVYCSLLLAILVLALFDFHTDDWFEPRYRRADSRNSFFSSSWSTPAPTPQERLGLNASSAIDVGLMLLDAVRDALAIMAAAVNGSVAAVVDGVRGRTQATGQDTAGSVVGEWVKNVLRREWRINCLDVVFRL